MLKIGLTGGIGSGKSTAADIFSSLGVTIIDADLIAHQLTLSGNECFSKIIHEFGNSFITSDGELDRKKMAETVFSDLSKKSALENILHPIVRQRILHEIALTPDSPYIVLSIPLLFESNFTDLVDRIIVIDADDDIRIRRTSQRDGRSEAQIQRIMDNQVDRQTRLEQANDILENNGELEDLRASIYNLHKKYLNMTS
ncbi:MAG: dephospho-CoA kinase [Gammaproteobacteria bacterium]|nr:dephospho-CoA kinase [Gammaproteobacteria bacterium]